VSLAAFGWTIIGWCIFVALTLPLLGGGNP
jgi:hypothetical protein